MYDHSIFRDYGGPEINGIQYRITIIGDNGIAAVEWCTQRFGDMEWQMIEENPPVWKSSNNHWAVMSGARAFNNEYRFGFLNESDYVEFALKWL